MMRDPMLESVRSLALIAVQASGADGYAIFEFDASGALLPSHSSAPSFPCRKTLQTGRQVFQEDDASVAAYALHIDGDPVGQIAFAFPAGPIQPEKLAILDRMSALIQAVRVNQHATAKLASKIGSLDAELAAIKIAERAHGLLQNGGLQNGQLANGAPTPDAVDIIARHVETVLQGRQAGGALEELLRELEDRLDERKLLVRAKALLQSEHGITEEQAYLQLRVRSRSSRKRLRAVAQELIGAASARGFLEEQKI